MFKDGKVGSIYVVFSVGVKKAVPLVSLEISTTGTDGSHIVVEYGILIERMYNKMEKWGPSTVTKLPAFISIDIINSGG
jgi:hypothetical protein